MPRGFLGATARRAIAGHGRTERDGDIDSARDEREPARWTRRGTACAALFGAILLSSVGIIAWDRTSGSVTLAPQVRSLTGSAGLPAASTGVSGPARGAGGTPNDSPTPGRVTWLQVGLGALPFSATAGPSTVRAGVPSGFAHTRAGAVQATIQILGRLSWSAQTRASMQAVVDASTTFAAHAQVVVSYGPPTDPSVIPQVAGFQIVTYSPAQAVVNVALRFNGVLRVCPATVEWTAQTAATTAGATSGSASPVTVSDWRLTGAPGPLDQTSWAAIEDLTGYVLFSGQPTVTGN